MKENHFHQELLNQVIGMVENEIGGYLFELQNKAQVSLWGNDSLQLWFSEDGAGFDVYVLDPAYVEFDVSSMRAIHFKENNECGFSPCWYFLGDEVYSFYYTSTEDWSMIGHYHGNDLLHIVVSWEEEKRQLKNHVLRIFNNYLNRVRNEKIHL